MALDGHGHVYAASRNKMADTGINTDFLLTGNFSTLPVFNKQTQQFPFMFVPSAGF